VVEIRSSGQVRFFRSGQNRFQVVSGQVRSGHFFTGQIRSSGISGQVSGLPDLFRALDEMTIKFYFHLIFDWLQLYTDFIFLSSFSERFKKNLEKCRKHYYCRHTAWRPGKTWCILSYSLNAKHFEIIS